MAAPSEPRHLRERRAPGHRRDAARDAADHRGRHACASTSSRRSPTINEELQATWATSNDVGVPLSNRRIENTVVVADGETVVIGGLISDRYHDDRHQGALARRHPHPRLGLQDRRPRRSRRRTCSSSSRPTSCAAPTTSSARRSASARSSRSTREARPGPLRARARRREEAALKRGRGDGRALRARPRPQPRAPRAARPRGALPARAHARDRAAAARGRASASARGRGRRRARRSTSLQAAICGDEDAATDAAHRRWSTPATTARSSPASVGGRLLYEIRVGPYESLEQAEDAVRADRAASHGLTPVDRDPAAGAAMSEAPATLSRAHGPRAPRPRRDPAARRPSSPRSSSTRRARAPGRERRAPGGPPARREGHVSADEVLDALSRQLDLPIRPQHRRRRGRRDAGRARADRLRQAPRLLPLQRDERRRRARRGRRTRSTPSPLDDLRLLFDGAEVRLELANQRTILGAINEVYDRGPGSTDALAEDAAEDLDSLAERDQPGAAGPARRRPTTRRSSSW